jgi:DsbC/DsbD-like thiol-disulfide interchange protein
VKLRLATAAAAAALLPLAIAAFAQQGALDLHAKRQWVSFLGADSQTLPAGKPSTVELRFAVAEGLHVNSHRPTGESLIATELALDAPAGVRLGNANYPAGSEYHFAFDPHTQLDVYTGEFAITQQVTAAAGRHPMHGTLRYQACDHAACYPPRTLPVEFTVAAQ